VTRAAATARTSAGRNRADVVSWDPPEKGDWRGLHDHFTRPVTPEYRRLLAAGMEAGEAESFAAYGIPARTILCRFVNGRVFISAAPLVGRPTSVMPPAPLLWLASRLVPAFRRRSTAARQALADRRWLDEAAHWYDVERPAWQARGAALEAVDPGALSDSELAEHLGVVRQTADEGYRTHFRLHGPDLLPLGMLLARGEDWGIDAPTLLGLLVGSSPASTGSGSLPAWRLVSGYDLDGLCAAELPAVAAMHPPHRTTAAADRDPVRTRVPVDDRPELDQLVDDACAVYDLRDDNGIWTAAWPVGLLRRAMLEGGRRLVGRGRFRAADDAVEVTVDELLALLAEHGGPSANEIAERRRIRLGADATTPPPPALGPPAVMALGALPAAMRTMVRALLAVRDHSSVDVSIREPLTGEGIGTALGVGRAVVAEDAAEALARFEPGDVLVARGTAPAYNVILACAAAVVTEEGGQLSHAAVVARELGLPAVIGAAQAVSRIPDGSLVEVDPVAGRVRLLPTSPPRRVG
jgi:rifampicin phosphotransferase